MTGKTADQQSRVGERGFSAKKVYFFVLQAHLAAEPAAVASAVALFSGGFFVAASEQALVGAKARGVRAENESDWNAAPSGAACQVH